MTQFAPKSNFAIRLATLLETLNLSRVALARELQVDKSVVARWLAGTNQPTTHNLTRLTELLRRVEPNATVASWISTPAAAAAVEPRTALQHVQTIREALPQGLESNYDGLWGGFIHVTEGDLLRPTLFCLRAGAAGLRVEMTDGTNTSIGIGLATQSFLQMFLEVNFLQTRVWTITLNGVISTVAPAMTGLLLTGFPGMSLGPTVSATPMVLVRLADPDAWDRIGGAPGAVAALLQWRREKAASGKVPGVPHGEWHSHAHPVLLDALVIKVGVARVDGELDLIPRMPRSRERALGESYFTTQDSPAAFTIGRFRAALGLD